MLMPASIDALVLVFYWLNSRTATFYEAGAATSCDFTHRSMLAQSKIP